MLDFISLEKLRVALVIKVLAVEKELQKSNNLFNPFSLFKDYAKCTLLDKPLARRRDYLDHITTLNSMLKKLNKYLQDIKIDKLTRNEEQELRDIASEHDINIDQDDEGI